MYADAKRDAMVGGSQGVHKGLIYCGFNILLFFLHMPKGFRLKWINCWHKEKV